MGLDSQKPGFPVDGWISEIITPQARCSVMPRHMTWWIELRPKFQPLTPALFSGRPCTVHNLCSLTGQSQPGCVRSYSGICLPATVFQFHSLPFSAHPWGTGGWEMICLCLGKIFVMKDFNHSLWLSFANPSRSWAGNISSSIWLSRPQLCPSQHHIINLIAWALLAYHSL